MFGKRLTLMRVLGFEIRLDFTWIILAALIVWTLSAGYFPAYYRDLPGSTYLWMGIVAAIGLFASIVLHELAHSLVGRRLGIEIKGITLFVLGGAAELTEEPPTPRAEAIMAAAGPIMSVILAILFQLLAIVLDAAGGSEPIVAVIGYLAGINLILALFNLAPAYPLDGGRILRAALWAWRGDVRWATKWAAAIGGGLGLGLILLGLFSVLQGNFGGLWWCLIGLFVRAAASQSYTQLVARETLKGLPVSRFMNRSPIAVSPDLPVSALIEDYVLGRSLKLIPVVADGRLLGAVSAKQLKEISAAERAGRRIRDVLTPHSAKNTVAPQTEAHDALALMQRNGNSRLLVADGDRLQGIVALKDLLSYLTLRLDFDETSGAPQRPTGTPAE